MARGPLLHVKTSARKPLVEGRSVSGFTRGAEADVDLTKVVPSSSRTNCSGDAFPWSRAVYVVTDGLLIAGQNPGVWSEISD
jgi:hypothetical protein